MQPFSRQSLARRRVGLIGAVLTCLVAHAASAQAGWATGSASIAIIGTQLALIIGLVLQSFCRRRAELKLRESETRFRSIANCAPVSIWMLDESGLDEFFNAEWLRLVGGTHESARLCGWMSQVHPDQYGEVMQRFAAVFEAKERFDGEIRLRCGDLYRWMYCTGVPRYDAAGAFVGYVCSATDIEQRKQVEAATTELAHAARLVAIGELTATLAHELKQPISAMLANIEAALLLMGSHSPPPLAELINILQDIRNDDLRAAAAIARIGGLARKQELRFEAVDLRQTIGEVLRFVASECHAYGVQARTELQDALPSVYADRVQLQQVFLNLVINAIEAMKASPVRGRRLTISARMLDETQAEIAISDTGTGIDPAQLPHVFEAFFTTKQEGMGLGLRLVHSIIESHRGSIWAANNSGPGATFRFTLPVAAARQERVQSQLRCAQASSACP